MISHHNPVEDNWDTQQSGKFIIKAKSYNDAILELTEWAKTHRQYWIWYADGDYTTYMIEVSFKLVAPPGPTMMFWNLYQEGSEQNVAPYDVETASKHMALFTTIGSSIKDNRDDMASKK